MNVRPFLVLSLMRFSALSPWVPGLGSFDPIHLERLPVG